VRLLRALRADLRLAALLLVAALAAGALVELLVSGHAAPSASAAVAAPDAARDSDGDGVPDLEEVARWGTNLFSPDSDGDGLPDAWEIAHSRADAATGERCPDPARPDAQADCLGKGTTLAQDLAAGTDPWKADTDGDGIPDAYETTHGMDSKQADAAADPFHDGITNLERYHAGARGDRLDTACSGMGDGEKVRAGLDPSRASTGGSGVPDGWALHFGLDPRDPAIGALRLDGDPSGLTALEKAQASFARLDLCARLPGVEPPFAKGLDPRSADSDGDGMPDAWEIRYGLDPLDPSDAAKDGGGGVPNLQAYRLGFCPDKPDCDGDGLTNAEEALVGWNVTVDGVTRHVTSDPMRPVSDGDHIPDKAKRDGAWTAEGKSYHFSPLDPGTADTDGDGLPDAVEVAKYAGLLDPAKRDSDGDGMPDGEKVAYWDGRAAADPAHADRLCALCGQPPNVADPDVDGDGIRNGDEVHPPPRPVAPGSAQRAAFPATDPASGDTDGDGLPDAWERANARWLADLGAWDLDPSRADSLAGLPGDSRGCGDAPSCADAARDLDGDALPAKLELAAGTDPHAADTDGDGLPDGWEYQHGAAGGARFAATAVAGRGFSWLGRAGAPVPLSPTDPADADAPLARYQSWANGTMRSVTWTFRDAYRLNASTTRPDGAGDGLPDFWKALRGAADPAKDPDGDGLTNLQEFAAGTDPLRADTDGGGLPDGLEARLHLDPLSPADDAAQGDADGDGLSNADEIGVYHTDPDSPDSIGKGLLDGPDVTLPDAPSPLRDRLLSLGIVHERQADGSLRFLGNFDVAKDPAKDCAHKVSCAGDGLPDAWKLHYGLDATAYHTPSESPAGDGIGLLAKYRWGRPANWSEESDGPWWLGLDPTRRATAQDLSDLDRDGLNDTTGEDPTPYYGAVDVHDRGAAFAALLAREGQAAPPPVAPARLVLDAPPSALVKGGEAEARGHLVADGPRGGVPVLARIATDAEAEPSADPALAAGVAFTRDDGSFTLRVRLAPDQSTQPPDGAVLFGAVQHGNVSWRARTDLAAPGGSARLLVWSYGVRRSSDVLSGASALTAPLPVRANASLPPLAASAAPGAEALVALTLEDGAGDLHAPLLPDALRLDVGGASLAPQWDGANATFRVPVPADAREPLAGTLRWSGDGALGAAEAPVAISPRLPTVLAVAAQDASALTSGSLALSGSLSSGGAPLAGAPVSLAFGPWSGAALTGPDGSYHAQVPLAGFPLGGRQPRASFAGDGLHEAANATGRGATVRAAPALGVERLALRLGEPATLRGTLLAAGAPLDDPSAEGGAVVRVRAGALALLGHPDAQGRFSVALPASLAQRPGPVALSLDVDASPLADAAHIDINLEVAAPARLLLDDATAVRGHDALLQGALLDAAGAPIAGAPVLVENATAATDAEGRFAARVPVPADASLGAAPWRAAFAGAGDDEAASATGNLTVLAALRVEADPAALVAGAPWLTGHATLDAGGPAPLSSLSLDGQPVGVDETGAFRLALGNATARVRALSFHARAPGGHGVAPLDQDLGVLVLQPSRLAIPAPPEDLAPGSHVTLSAALDDALGPLAGETISWSLGNRTLGHVATGPDGVARLDATIPQDAPLGPTTLRASFAGNGGDLPSESAAPTRVRERPTLRLDALGGRLRVEVLDGAGRPAADAPLLLRLDGQPFPLVARTDAAGVVEARLPPGSRVVAEVVGAPDLLPASAVATLAPAPFAPASVAPWIAGAAVALAALLVLGLAAARRLPRRERREVAQALAEAEAAFEASDEHGAAAVLAYRHLLAALARGGHVVPRSATPGDVRAALREALGLPEADVDVVVDAFELARYAQRGPDARDAARVAAALARLREALP